MKESIISASFKRFKKNSLSYIAVGVICALFFVLVALLSFIDEMAFFVAVPILAFPFLFASHVSCYLLEAAQPINWGNFFKYFISFFRPQFRGSFRGIISFFKALAVYGVCLAVSSLTTFLIFQGIYGDTFFSLIKDLFFQYQSGVSMEEIQSLLNANNGMLLTFFSFVLSTPLPFAITAFIYFVSFSSIALYYRANVTSGAPSLLRLGIASAYNEAKKEMHRDWLKLNWPLIVLPLVGSISGGLVCIFAFKSYLSLAPVMTLSAFPLLVFFLPFYFSNMEVLYQRYEKVFKESNKKAIEIILSRIQNSIGLSEEEKRQLEESFKEDRDDKEENE